MPNPPVVDPGARLGAVAAYTVEPTTNTSRKLLLPSPSAVVRFVKLDPPSVEMPNPLVVAAYTVEPDANTPNTTLLPSPSAVVRFTKVG